MTSNYRPGLSTIRSSNSRFSVFSSDGSVWSSRSSNRKAPKPSIHAITAFIEINETDFREKTDYAFSSFPVLGAKIDATAGRLKELQALYQEEGYTVALIQIATNPFGMWLLQSDEFVLAKRLEFLDALLKRHGITGCCLGPARSLRELACVRQILAASERFHCFFVLDAKDAGAAYAATDTIYDVSSLHPLGVANARFCVASKTCPPWNPFFPVAYCQAQETEASNIGLATDSEACTPDKAGRDPLVVRLAIGLDNGRLVQHLLRASGDVEHIDIVFREGLRQALVPIQDIASGFCSKSTPIRNNNNEKSGGNGRIGMIQEIDSAFHDAFVHALFPPGINHDCSHSSSGKPSLTIFMGIDTTIGSPSHSSSLVRTLESLDDIEEFGDCETFAACSAIRNVLQTLEGIGTTGFCGISLPVGSDRRFVELIDSMASPLNLLNIASVLGNGVDMLPIRGKHAHFHTQSRQSLQSLLLDGVALAEKSQKPLIFRILPIPGKMKGDVVNYKDSQCLMRCKVVDVHEEISEC